MSKGKKITARDKHWTQGFACACYIAAKELGEDKAKRILEVGGFDGQDLLDHDVERVDIETLCPEIPLKVE